MAKDDTRDSSEWKFVEAIDTYNRIRYKHLYVLGHCDIGFRQVFALTIWDICTNSGAIDAGFAGKWAGNWL